MNNFEHPSQTNSNPQLDPPNSMLPASPEGNDPLQQEPSTSQASVPEISAEELRIPEDLASIFTYFQRISNRPCGCSSCFGQNRQQLEGQVSAPTREAVVRQNTPLNPPLPHPYQILKTSASLAPKGPSVAGAFLSFAKAAMEPSGPA